MIIPKKIVSQYQAMLNDTSRNLWFKKHIETLVRDKVFIDIGAGTGILSAYAIEAGASHGYAIENNNEAFIVGKHLLKDIGYQDKVTWINQDFKGTNISKADVVIAEQVGPALFDEIQIEIWKHYNKLYGSDYISLPDELAIDLHIYEGNTTELINQIIFDDTSLPAGFYSSLEKLSVKPAQVIENFISVTKNSVTENNIETILSLRDYSQATLVFINKIGFRHDYLYLNRSCTQNWKFPPRLFINDCTDPIRIFWNSELSNKENPYDTFYKGYWDYEKISK